MRLFGVQKGCVKISELFVSILFAPVAQRIERRFPKPCVGGSSPLGGASIFRSALGGPFLFDVARYGEWLKTCLVVIQPMGEFIGCCVYGGTDFAIVSRLRPAYSIASLCRPPVPLIALVRLGSLKTKNGLDCNFFAIRDCFWAFSFDSVSRLGLSIVWWAVRDMQNSL